jgi:hypothetical protein
VAAHLVNPNSTPQKSPLSPSRVADPPPTSALLLRAGAVAVGLSPVSVAAMGVGIDSQIEVHVPAAALRRAGQRTERQRLGEADATSWTIITAYQINAL